VSRIVLVIAALVLVCGAPAALQHSPLRLNASASVPTGLYRVVPQTSRYAAICLSEPILATARQAGLFIPAGECPDGKEPILKPIYRASADSPITFSPSGFSVAERALKNTAAKLRSKKGEPLSHVAYGTYTTGLWAISDYNPDSFDSRYFGPITEANVRYYAVPFLLF
jgi:conjugative transfer signal peptidase TraF